MVMKKIIIYAEDWEIPRLEKVLDTLHNIKFKYHIEELHKKKESG